MSMKSPQPTKRKRSDGEDIPISKRRQLRPRPLVCKRRTCCAARLNRKNLDQVPSEAENTAERVRSWAGLSVMSSNGSGGNTRKRSRRSSTTASQFSRPTTAPSDRGSLYDRNAADLLMDNNVFGPSYLVDLSNKQELQSALDRDRRSLSPSAFSDSKFDQFLRAHRRASNEGQLIAEVIHPYLTGYFDHTSSTDLAFPLLKPIVAPPGKLPPPKPDHSFGTAKEHIDVNVRRTLGSYIVGAAAQHTPAAVNDMMQAKGPDGSARVLETQVTLDGAIGERAMHKLHSFGCDRECPADGISRAFVQSYHAGTMKFYAAHRQPGAVPHGPDRIYTSEIAGQYLCGSPQQLRDGIRMYRNNVELATRYRTEAVNHANARAADHRADCATGPRHVRYSDGAEDVVDDGSSNSDSEEYYDVDG